MSAETDSRLSSPQSNVNIVVVGNSFSTNSPTITWPTMLQATEAFQQSTVVNNAAPGESLATTIANFSASVAPYAAAKTGKPLLVILPAAAGVDVLGSLTAAQCYSEIQTYAGLVHGIGGKLVVGGVPAGSSYAGAFETKRVALNVLIAAGRADYDFYWAIAETYVSTAAAYMQGDGQHLSTLGHQIASQQAAAAMQQAFLYTSEQMVMNAATIMTMAGLTFLANDNSTNIGSLTNAGIWSLPQITVNDIAGGFGFGGIHGTNWAMGQLGVDLYLAVPGGGGGFHVFVGGVPDCLVLDTSANLTTLGNLQSSKGLALSKTITAGGTTGAQIINKSSGSVNFAATASSLVVTNSVVTTSSVIIATVATNDTTMKSVQAVAANGSFTLFSNAVATAETRVNFVVLN